MDPLDREVEYLQMSLCQIDTRPTTNAIACVGFYSLDDETDYRKISRRLWFFSCFWDLAEVSTPLLPNRLSIVQNDMKIFTDCSLVTPYDIKKTQKIGDCQLFDAKPLTSNSVDLWQLATWEQTSVKFDWWYNSLLWRKWQTFCSSHNDTNDANNYNTTTNNNDNNDNDNNNYDTNDNNIPPIQFRVISLLNEEGSRNHTQHTYNVYLCWLLRLFLTLVWYLRCEWLFEYSTKI